MAKLVAHQPVLEPRTPGWGKGWIKILPGFDEADEEIARDFGIVD